MGHQHDSHLLAEEAGYPPYELGKEITYIREETTKTLDKPFLSSFVMVNRGQTLSPRLFNIAP